MDTVGLALIDTAEAEVRRHNQYQASSLADHMTSFQRFLNAAIAVQTHFNLPTDGTPYTWDELRQMAQLSAHAGNSIQDETGGGWWQTISIF